MEPGILHLVAWTKATIPTRPGDGDLTPESRERLAKFVNNTFTRHLGEDNVLWFKNWASIQSVRSVEHIHILIRNYSDEFLKKVVTEDANARPVGEIVREREQEHEEEGRGGVCREEEAAVSKEHAPMQATLRAQ